MKKYNNPMHGLTLALCGCALLYFNYLYGMNNDILFYSGIFCLFCSSANALKNIIEK